MGCGWDTDRVFCTRSDGILTLFIALPAAWDPGSVLFFQVQYLLPDWKTLLGPHSKCLLGLAFLHPSLLGVLYVIGGARRERSMAQDL